MAARLLIYSGSMRGGVFPLPPEGKVVIGRSQNTTLPLPDVNLSRSHCSVAATPQGYVLSDLNSTNGTFLNGKKVTQVLLREGDKVTLGETEIEFRVKERFDDNETKMDMMSVGKAEEISPSEALQMMKATPMDSAKATGVHGDTPIPAGGAPIDDDGLPPGILGRIRFCDICDVNVPRDDRESGAAREIEQKMLCVECIGRLQSKNVDAAASLGPVLEELRSEVLRGQS